MTAPSLQVLVRLSCVLLMAGQFGHCQQTTVVEQADEDRAIDAVNQLLIDLQGRQGGPGRINNVRTHL